MRLGAGPNCHLVHYPLRGGEQYNVVVTFHSREHEEWGVTEGSREEVLSYFEGIGARPRQLLRPAEELEALGHGRPRADRTVDLGRATLLGDAAHPMLQYLAQGACMALEDAVTLGEAVRASGGDFARAFERYERARIARTARVVLLAREMGRIYHAKGVERLVRNDLWKGRSARTLLRRARMAVSAGEWRIAYEHDVSATAQREDFYRRIDPHHMAPLWTRLKALVPREPTPIGVPYRWRYAEVRPHVMESRRAHLARQEAERRVLILENPGLRGTSQITSIAVRGAAADHAGRGRARAPPHAIGAALHRRRPRRLHRRRGRADWRWSRATSSSRRRGRWHLTTATTATSRWSGSTASTSPWPTTSTAPSARTTTSERPERRGARRRRALRYPVHAEARATPAGARPRGRARPAPRATCMRYRDPADGGWAMPTMAPMLRWLPSGFRHAALPLERQHGLHRRRGRAAASRRTARQFEISSPAMSWWCRGGFPIPCAGDGDLVLFSYSDRAAQEKLGFFREQRL